MQAYCVKCRAKREMQDAKAITMKNGKPATQGPVPGMRHQDVPYWFDKIAVYRSVRP